MATSTIASTYPMSAPAYTATVFTPMFIFALLSLPVKKRNIIQEAILIVLLFAELAIPIIYVGQFSFLFAMSVSVWAWAFSMKMGIWLFSTSMEERRQGPFIFTLTDWRKRTTSPPTDTTSANIKFRPDEYMNDPLGRLIFTFIKHQLVFDTVDFILSYSDYQLPIRVHSALLSNIFSLLGQTSKAATLAPVDPLTYSNIIISTLMCMFLCVFVQIQLQITYDIMMITYAIIYKILPTLEKWQLEDSKKVHTKNIVKSKAILQRLRYIRAVKSYIEDILSMQSLFDSPWAAHSLRDFWGRRWHTFYNDCFYRLGYIPLRWAVKLLFNCKPPRWSLALSVFFMSGIMHEYYLFASTGPFLYFGSPIPACGLQFLFFVVQVCFISIGDTFSNRGMAGRLYAIFCMAVTSHLFVMPFILTGYFQMERFFFYRVAIHFYRYFC